MDFAIPQRRLSLARLLTSAPDTPEEDTSAVGGGFVHEEASEDENSFQHGSPDFNGGYRSDDDSGTQRSGGESDSQARSSSIHVNRPRAEGEDGSPVRQASTQADIQPGVVSSASKRKKFTKTDDVTLLRQVLADLPFEAFKGQVMNAWESVAKKLKTLEGFSKTETISGKSAQARFNTLLASHRKFDNKSLGESGIDQHYAEKRQLLDDLIQRYDEHERAEAKKSRDRKDKLEAEENAGKVMRQAGLKRMKERKKEAEGQEAEDATSSKRYKTGVIDLMRENLQADREEKRRQWEAENEEKSRRWQEEREERREERKLRLQLAQMEQERLRMENDRLQKMLSLAQQRNSPRSSVDGSSSTLHHDRGPRGRRSSSSSHDDFN